MLILNRCVASTNSSTGQVLLTQEAVKEFYYLLEDEVVQLRQKIEEFKELRLDQPRNTMLYAQYEIVKDRHIKILTYLEELCHHVK